MRPDLDTYYLNIAHAVSLRGTCTRRRVGCVLVNKRGRTLAEGYNGVAAGEKHCIDHPCPGAEAPSGQGLDLCQAIHAEQNAVAICSDIYAVGTCYCTASPCVSCTKLLLGTSCQKIVFIERYPHHEAEELWARTGRLWLHKPLQVTHHIGEDNRLQIRSMVGQ